LSVVHNKDLHFVAEVNSGRVESREPRWRGDNTVQLSHHVCIRLNHAWRLPVLGPSFGKWITGIKDKTQDNIYIYNNVMGVHQALRCQTDRLSAGCWSCQLDHLWNNGWADQLHQTPLEVMHGLLW